MIDLKSLILAKKMFGGTGSSDAEATPEQSKTVDLAMADGNQTITPDEGYLLSSVTVNKPETLIPENIAEGIDIGGVIGSLVASSGGGNIQVESGTFTGNGGIVEITHTLGKAPDVFICGLSEAPTTSNVLKVSVGFSKEFDDFICNGYLGQYSRTGSASTNSSKNGLNTDVSAPLNASNSNTLLITTSTTVSVGNSSFATNDGLVYNWVAIAGLVG